VFGLTQRYACWHAGTPSPKSKNQVTPFSATYEIRARKSFTCHTFSSFLHAFHSGAGSTWSPPEHRNSGAALITARSTFALRPRTALPVIPFSHETSPCTRSMYPFCRGAALLAPGRSGLRPSLRSSGRLRCPNRLRPAASSTKGTAPLAKAGSHGSRRGSQT